MSINKALKTADNTKIVQLIKNKILKRLIYSMFKDFLSDLDWIQTSNLLSRNQVRYSVAPQGQIISQMLISDACSVNFFAGANISIIV